MKRTIIFSFTFLIAFVFSVFHAKAQETDSTKKEKAYEFQLLKDLPHTSIPNQYRSGTCWSFAGISFIEAEILRTRNKVVDLSEMFVVRTAYSKKALKYVRLHGHLNFGPGGGFSDVLMSMADFGLIPEAAYNGLVIGEEKHTHGEMDEVLKSYADAVLKNKNRRLTPVWHQGFDALLDTYLGVVPDTFTFEGLQYTSHSFAKAMGIDPDDYIELTSFTHQPYYQAFAVEVPDNWMWSKSYNLPLEELMQTLDYALESGYTVAWGADVSEKGFSWKNGFALIPEEQRSDLSGTEKERWEALSAAEKQKAMYAFEKYLPEKIITPEIRQAAYDNYETTDDHLMHFVGIAEDQRANRYYKVKNSWGTEDHIYEGYLFASVSYVKYKTLFMLLHKDAIPKNIREKLGF